MEFNQQENKISRLRTATFSAKRSWEQHSVTPLLLLQILQQDLANLQRFRYRACFAPHHHHHHQQHLGWQVTSLWHFSDNYTMLSQPPDISFPVISLFIVKYSSARNCAKGFDKYDSIVLCSVCQAWKLNWYNRGWNIHKHLFHRNVLIYW